MPLLKINQENLASLYFLMSYPSFFFYLNNPLIT